MSQSTFAGYNPAALLAPKASGKINKALPSTNNRDDSSQPNGGSESPEAPGMSAFIEKMHKVEKRADRPVKRQKVEAKDETNEKSEDDLVDVKAKQQFDGVGGSGDMGSYLKEKRQELQDGKPEPPRQEVDLTLEDSEEEEDDFVITKDDTTVEVCLGRIENARVNAHKVPTPRTKSTFQTSGKIWMAMSVSLHRRPGSNAIIGVKDPTDKDFGNIDQRVATALSPLMDGSRTTKLRLQARLDARPKKPFDYPGQQISDHFAITINVYAQKKFVPGLGKWLSQHQIWLRDPLSVDRHVQICNPHKAKELDAVRATNVGRAKGGSSSSTVVVRTHEEIKKSVQQVFDSLKEEKDWPEMQAPKTVITKLLPHQSQALYFLNKRERLPVLIDDGTNMVLDDEDEKEGGTDSFSNNGRDEEDIWQKNMRPDGKIRWVNAITGHEVKIAPEPLLGGILGDVMGLGKTLNILSLIVGSLTQARKWGRKRRIAEDEIVQDGHEEGFGSIYSHATLLVCPLSTIVNWVDQIRTHLSENAITYCLYQGQGRTNEAEDLQSYDLVITTYQSVGNEYGRTYRNRPNKPLFEMNWFRVVLDEAHQIRNTSSGQSKAACALHANRRWCVTGTPVQNRLEDLGALIKFLKIKPFHEQGNFSKYISAPLRTGNEETIPKLRILVDLITLRRLKDKLDLPKRSEGMVRLQMSESERNLYDQFTRDTTRKVEAMAGQKNTLGGKSYAQVLKAIGRLRMLCAHGGDMLSDDDWEFAKGFDALNAIDLEDEDDSKPDKLPQQAFEMFRLMKEANVAYCSKCEDPIEPIQELEGLEDEEEDETIGFLTPCNQLLCPNCIGSWKREMAKVVGPDNRGVCTICENYIRPTSFELKQRAMREDAETQAFIQTSKFAKNIARYSGPHSKTQALLRSLEENESWSQEHPNERPIKSVVFSEWTSHLDLIQLAFTNAKIKFTRLDGSTTFHKRTSALNEFAVSNEINVILVSLKAGGLGLNLTAASRVYVMEPNYNPQAEQQAIERVHRLGQKRDVVIQRFIMQDSIEEKVVELQRKKMALADFSLKRDKKDEPLAKSGTKQNSRKTLEEIRDLLR